MVKKKSKNLYSDEVNEMIGKSPSWIIRWGITLIAILLSILIISCLFIRVPQTIDSNIVLHMEKKQNNNLSCNNIKTILLGEMYVSSSEIYKVKYGQLVIVRINRYPSKDYGFLIGEVSNISDSILSNKGYKIEVLFTKGLITSYNKKLKYIPGMNGIAKVQIAKYSLFSYFFKSKE